MKQHGYVLTINNPHSGDYLLNESEEFREEVEAYKASTDKFSVGWQPHKDFSVFSTKAEFYKAFPVLKKHGIEYVLYGFEKGKAGTRHYQMVVVFSKPTSFNKVKQIWPRAHIERMRGSLDEARKYIISNKDKKDPKYKERYYGTSLKSLTLKCQMDNELFDVIKTQENDLSNLRIRQDNMDSKLDSIHALLVGLAKETNGSSKVGRNQTRVSDTHKDCE